MAKSSSSKLRFAYVETKNSGYRMIDDLGFGTIDLVRPFISENQAICREAIFHKALKKYEN